ncbi:MAG: hypothetical protein Fur0043_02970 [Anaerolineales bacterium]
MDTKRPPSYRWADLILFFSLLFGAIVRFVPTIMADSPINDGGMFYVMIENLKANHFLLPAFTTYNHLNIPFAYPPLSFYVGGFFSSLGLSTLDVVRWLPPLVSTLSILAFYWMAGQILASRENAVLSTLAYAMMPRSFSWYVMGGGLSRAFGVLFLLLTCASAWTLFLRRDTRYIFLAALFGAGALLSHPETGLHAAAACFLIWLFKGRSLRGFTDAFLVVCGVSILTAPWWATVLSQHGLSPFISALNTGGHNGAFWLPWLTFDFAEEKFITLLTILGLIGFVVQGLRHDWFLPVWTLAAFVIEPRSATAIAALPLAILAGLALADFILPNIAMLSSQLPALHDWTEAMANSGAVKIMIGYILFSTLFGAFFYDLTLSRYHVSSESRSAMVWSRTNTAPGSQFIVLSQWTDQFADPTAEWFPVFADRISTNTIQGREWLLGKNFMPFRASLEKLHDCLNESPSCVEDWADANRVTYDYIFIEKFDTPALLPYLLRQSTEYTLIFENSGAVIFARK